MQAASVSSGSGINNGEDVLFKTYHYKDGKGQETVYYKKDVVEINMESYTIPAGCDTYENIVSKMRSNKIFSHQQLFYETYDIMTDYYDGKISKDEVKDIFEQYFYHVMGEDYKVSSEYDSQRVQKALSELYEHFSRSNTRNAVAKNQKEGQEILKNNGMSIFGASYYNADWYYACEEMQEMFREIADRLSDETGAEHIDFASVEKNTMFQLDGGITFHGVWNWANWQNNHSGMESTAKITDENVVPPRDFIYCTAAVWEADGKRTEQFKEDIRALQGRKSRKSYQEMTLIAELYGRGYSRESLLYDRKNYSSYSDKVDESLYHDAISFLKNFDILYRGSRMEFLHIGKW